MARTTNKVLSANNAHEVPVEVRRHMEYLQTLQTLQTSPAVRRLSIRPVGSPPRQEAAHRLARMRRVIFRRSRLANGTRISPPLEVDVRRGLVPSPSLGVNGVNVLRGLMRQIEGIDVTLMEATPVAVEGPGAPPVVDFVEIA